MLEAFRYTNVLKKGIGDQTGPPNELGFEPEPVELGLVRSKQTGLKKYIK